MERKQSSLLQNFEEPKSEILKKRLLKTKNIVTANNLTPSNLQQNVIGNTVRAPIPSSMIVSSVQAPQSSIPITHNLVTHSIAPVKIHNNNSTYPLQLSTVHVPVQIPGSAANINVPVQLSAATSVPLQLSTPTVSLPLQMSGTTSVPVQLSAGETINVPLQISNTQNIHIAGPGLPTMPILQNPGQQLHNSFIHVHMGSNSGSTNIEGTDMNVTNSTQLRLTDSNGVQVKLSTPITTNQVQIANSNVVHIPNSSSNSIQLTLPNTGNSGSVQLRSAPRPVPHVVYIQTPGGLKPVTSSDVISQASSSGNPPQIIVRRPVTTSGNIKILKSNIAPKMTVPHTNSLLAPNVAEPIVIQKPKDKMIVPVSIATGGTSKQAIAYLGPVKKSITKVTESQSIILPKQTVSTTTNQKLFLTPMNMPKIQNTKFFLPVTLPSTMASKGPIINLQIANGQIQNDPQGNITVMRDTQTESSDMPPLQPLGKVANGKESVSVPHSPKGDKSFTVSIPGSRVESTGEQEYSLSIPETNASMNDDVYTVSIADEDGAQREKSFTLSIPEKGKSLLNRNLMDRDLSTTIPAPAILRRSNSDNIDRKTANANLKRRISLCAENISNKSHKLLPQSKSTDKIDEQNEEDNNDDHRVPSLFCDETLDKDLEPKSTLEDSDSDDYKDSKNETNSEKSNDYLYFTKSKESYPRKDSFTVTVKSESVDSHLEDDPPGLMWNNGVAVLNGSSLQFQTNEFGLIDLIDHSDQEENFVMNHTAKYNTPLKQRIDRSEREKKPTSPEDLYRCDGCGCHGMAAEFITPNYCSLTCQNDVQKSIQKKERMELNKRRKKLIMTKQFNDQQHSQAREKSYESTSNDRLSEANLRKMNEDFVENEKYPWMCGKNGFSWMRYLELCKAKAAPVKLFKDPFPYSRNGFKVSMRLEAIDPKNPSMFSVASVAEVQGYRLRVHFDEYPDVYDYWVNADSIDLFPAGWCEKNGRTLLPPANFEPGLFLWPLYLKEIRAIAAPRHLFPHISNTTIKPNSFRTGMKLEAEDRKNNLVCVATIADMMDNRMLINFDSWDEMYDYWVDPTSPYIHPVGWAEENGISLTPPNFYKDPDSFSWEAYLAETGATAAPARAFKTRPPQGFKIGMKLEVVDQRVPFLIRVASITEVKGHQIKVSFDGWPEELSCWMDDDSPDVHPVGWCLKTGHPLEPPLTPEERAVSGPCGVGGCRGLGSLRGGAHKQHGAASACPYQPHQRHLASPPGRLQRAGADHEMPMSRKVLGRLTKSPPTTSTPTSDSQREKLPRGRPPKHKRVEEVTKNDQVSSDESVGSSSSKRWRASPRSVEAAVFTRGGGGGGGGGGGRARRDVTLGPAPDVRAHIHALRLPPHVTDWTTEDVAEFISRLAGPSSGSTVSAARISGAELVMASRQELVDVAKLRLGPAIKVHAAIRQLRETLT